MYGVVLYVGLKFGAMIFFGPVTFQIYWPPGPVASEAYCGGLAVVFDLLRAIAEY